MLLWTIWVAQALEIVIPRWPLWTQADRIAKRIIGAMDTFMRPRWERWEQARTPVCGILLCGGAALVALIHPLACALVLWLALDARHLAEEASRAKRELDAGNFSTGEESDSMYDRVAKASLQALARGFVPGVFLPVLLMWLGRVLSWWMPALLVWAYIAMRALEVPKITAGIQRVVRLLEYVVAWTLALTSDLVGQHGRQARAQMRTAGKAQDRMQETLLAALGLGTDMESPRKPLSGDITQAILLLGICLLVWNGLLSVLLTMLLL